MGKSLSNKYIQKLLDSAKKIYSRCNKNCFKNSDLIGNKIADKIRSVSKKKSAKELHDNDETEKYVDVETATPQKRYILPEERQQIIEELRLIPKKYV